MREETPDQLAARFDAKARGLVVIAAYMGEVISEGQACTLLQVEPIVLREVIQEYSTVANWLWARYRMDGTTIDDDIRNYQLPPCHCNRSSD